MLVISNKPGQLANRLVVFSNFIALSLEHEIPLYDPAFDEYAPFFEGTNQGLLIKNRKPSHFLDRNILQRTISFKVFNFISKVFRRLPLFPFLCQSVFLTNDVEPFILDSENKLNILKSRKIIFLSGWLFRCPGIVIKHQNFIRNYFTPVKKYLLNITKTIAPIRKEYKTIVGIHIRRGDYKTFQNGRYFYEIEDYYKIMQKISEIFDSENTAFLICSNENIDTEIFKNLNVFKGTGHFVEDLYSLAECDYIAGPPSTSTMWASFYGQKPLYMIENIDHHLGEASFKIESI